MRLTIDQIKEIATETKARRCFFDAVNRFRVKINVSEKQAYNMVLSQVQVEFPHFEPYSGYESFRQTKYGNTKRLISANKK